MASTRIEMDASSVWKLKAGMDGVGAVRNSERLLRTAPRVYGTYKVWFLFDATMILGTVVLLACYVWARALGHVGVFCDISDLGANLPERILFRMNFSAVGALLVMIALPVHDFVKSRLSAGQSIMKTRMAAFFQATSGIGVILVGACAENEIWHIHIVGAVMGFGGSAIAQLIYNGVLFNEEKPSPTSKMLHWVRCAISVIFLVSAVILGLGEMPILPEPWEHIAEWVLWFSLLAWYSTFRWDMSDFVVASMVPGVSHFGEKKNLNVTPLPPA